MAKTAERIGVAWYNFWYYAKRSEARFDPHLQLPICINMPPVSVGTATSFPEIVVEGQTRPSRACFGYSQGVVGGTKVVPAVGIAK